MDFEITPRGGMLHAERGDNRYLASEPHSP